jgi:DNA repair exonuclease SbcCD nuclease subunit
MENKTDLEQLRGILQQFNKDTIVQAVKEIVLVEQPLPMFEVAQYSFGSLGIGSLLAAILQEDEKAGLAGKCMALDEIQAAIARLQKQKKEKEEDKELPDESKKFLNKIIDKAIEKLRKAAEDILKDYEDELKKLKDEAQKKRMEEVLKKMKEKFRTA